jgi:hypothetical protein
MVEATRSHDPAALLPCEATMLHARITVAPILGEIVVQARIFSVDDMGSPVEIAHAEKHYRGDQVDEPTDEFHALMVALRKFASWATLSGHK